MHTAPSLNEFLSQGTLVDWLEFFPIEIEIAVGEAYALAQLRVTAYGPEGSIEEHVPLSLDLEGPDGLLDLRDWRTYGETITGSRPGSATLWVHSIAGSSSGARVSQPIHLTVTP
ncbi:MAG: hypothetical protein ACJ0SL_01845 [Candidatus Rariloculaceae bacterium]